MIDRAHNQATEQMKLHATKLDNSCYTIKYIYFSLHGKKMFCLGIIHIKITILLSFTGLTFYCLTKQYILKKGREPLFKG